MFFTHMFVVLSFDFVVCCLLLINALVVCNYRANCGSSQPARVVELWQLRAAWERRDEAQYPVISSRARWLNQPQITRGRWRPSEWKERGKKRREKQHSSWFTQRYLREATVKSLFSKGRGCWDYSGSQCKVLSLAFCSCDGRIWLRNQLTLWARVVWYDWPTLMQTLPYILLDVIVFNKLWATISKTDTMLYRVTWNQQ